jgi:bifunctional non-homologous end joining protein LigD
MEVKFDGYRLLIRKQKDQVRVYTRRGADWTKRFPRLVSAARSIKAESFLIDGEGIVYDAKGMPNFALSTPTNTTGKYLSSPSIYWS